MPKLFGARIAGALTSLMFYHSRQHGRFESERLRSSAVEQLPGVGGACRLIPGDDTKAPYLSPVLTVRAKVIQFAPSPVRLRP